MVGGDGRTVGLRRRDRAVNRRTTYTPQDEAAFRGGVCPGCGGPLSRIGGSLRHYRAEQRIKTDGRGGHRITEAGEPVRSGSALRRSDPRLCEWNGDDLYSMSITLQLKDGVQIPT